MTVGSHPFSVDESGALCLEFKPVLPSWLFTQSEQNISLIFGNEKETVLVPKSSFGFMFLGEIFVTYTNGNKKDTFGDNAVVPTAWKITDREGNTEIHNSRKLTGDIVYRVRERKIKKIEIILE